MSHPRRPVATLLVVLLAPLVFFVALPRDRADAGAPRGGTLEKIKSSNTVTLGYRDSSRPFSFVGDDGKPAGYSVDLCNQVASSIAKQLGSSNLQVKWVKVTVADRIRAVANGTIDLECGSTTASLSRQEEVDFSLTTFIDGGSLLVTDASGIKAVSNLGGKRVAVIPGTTTDKSLREAIDTRGLSVTIMPVTDHAGGVAALDNGAVDAYASDRTILVGIGRTSRSPEKLSLIDDFFSYEPYGLMLRRNDAAFRLAVNRPLARLYRSGAIAPIVEKWFIGMPMPVALMRAMFMLNALPE